MSATTDATLPIIDLDAFRSAPDSPAARAQCAAAAAALVAHGAVLVRDARAAEADNDAFLDLLEDYFAQDAQALRKDERPECGYQVGVTLENTEKPKCAADEPCLRVIAALDPAERPLDISGHHPDPKCRFFWRMNDAVPPYATAFPALNAANVVPAAPDIRARWEPTLQKWGGTMRGAVEDLAEMLAVGLALARGTFRDAGRYGPHLLAPTASDLRLHGAPDTILAGFHTDLNFLTIHGRSRFPGLHVWARNAGRRVAVRFPPRADTGAVLLVQAGKQLEHASGGLVRAGFHEVVVNGATRAAMAARVRDAPERPLIRISSTFFWHLSSDHDLAPIPALAARARELRADARARGVEEEEVVYEPMKVGAQVQNELRHIALMA